MFEDKHIVLASSSPRRKDLLEQAGIAFTIKVNPVKEDFSADMPAALVAEYLASRKAVAARDSCDPRTLILAADTVVLLEDSIIGKPEDEKEAREILRSLSGRMHRVITGVCLLQGDKMKRFSEQTEVCFRMLTDGQINYYVEKYRPFDKAGAYGIQEWIGLVGVEKIEGDYFNVVGLPVGRVIEEIGMFPESVKHKT